MISDLIPKINETLESRGLPKDSYFEVEFFDGSKINEKETNWSLMSESKIIEFGFRKLTLYVANFPIKKISIFLNGLETYIDDISYDLKVYQFIRSQRLIARTVDKDSIFGRGIGLIKDNKVIEEKFINAIENVVDGRII